MSMFANAKTLAAPKKSSKKEAAKVEMEGLETLASIDSVIKRLETLKAVFEADVKKQATAEFIKNGKLAKKRPENFKGVEGEATASVQLKAKASNIAVSDEDAARLKAAGITTEKVVSTVGTYVINPKYLADAEVMENASAALVAAGLPEDLFEQQIETSKTIVTADALDELFGKVREDADFVALLPLISSIALKPTLTEDGQAADFEKVAELLGAAA